MANYQKGLRPVRYLNGAPWNGQATVYAVATNEGTAIGVGDLVKLNGGTDANGVRTVSRIAATTDAAVGVMVGVKPYPGLKTMLSGGATPTLDLPQYAPASAGVVKYIFVVDDDDVLFEAQEDGAGTPIAFASVGLNVSPTVAAASTTTGISTIQLDSDTVSTVGTLPLKLIEFVQAEDNTQGAAGARWIVKINSHQLAGLTAGV